MFIELGLMQVFNVLSLKSNWCLCALSYLTVKFLHCVDVIYLTVNSRHAPSLGMLCDHQPLQLNPDDYDRVCHIPKKKVYAVHLFMVLGLKYFSSSIAKILLFQGANFRDLPGVVVGENNRVEWDTTMDRVLLKSGKPLVLCCLQHSY